MKVFHSFGFSVKFCDWIHHIFLSARVSILMNGSPVGYSSCSRGVHQDDPLSPFLFVFAEDFLSRSLTRMVTRNDLSPIPANRSTFAPTRLLLC